MVGHHQPSPIGDVLIIDKLPIRIPSASHVAVTLKGRVVFVSAQQLVQ